MSERRRSWISFHVLQAQNRFEVHSLIWAIVSIWPLAGSFMYFGEPASKSTDFFVAFNIKDPIPEIRSSDCQNNASYCRREKRSWKQKTPLKRHNFLSIFLCWNPFPYFWMISSRSIYLLFHNFVFTRLFFFSW